MNHHYPREEILRRARRPGELAQTSPGTRAFPSRRCGEDASYGCVDWYCYETDTARRASVQRARRPD